jgi:3-deoxy-D-manno-octulosonic-acid transferase
MLPLYNVISVIGLIIYLPFLLAKKGPEDRGKYIRERLGLDRYDRADIWVHAVSVGEVLACIPFLKRLKKEFPSKSIVLSTTTYTGQKIAGERFTEADRIMYIPLDSGVCIKRVVDSIRPQIFITAETELWPVIFNALKKAGARILILNGRISNASFKGYSRINFLMKKVLSWVDFLYMQTREDAEKIISIGADPHKVAVMGNFKFDILFNDSPAVTWQNRIKGEILLAASTHKGEEEVILDAYELIRSRMQHNEHSDKNKESKSQALGLKLILAPRHPERFAEVEEILRKKSFSYIKRIEIDPLQDEEIDKADIILLDTVGELPLLFSRVTVGFIGGSLVPKGGHNIMEPGYWSYPKEVTI